MLGLNQQKIKFYRESDHVMEALNGLHASKMELQEHIAEVDRLERVVRNDEARQLNAIKQLEERVNEAIHNNINMSQTQKEIMKTEDTLNENARANLTTICRNGRHQIRQTEFDLNTWQVRVTNKKTNFMLNNYLLRIFKLLILFFFPFFLQNLISPCRFSWDTFSNIGQPNKPIVLIRNIDPFGTIKKVDNFFTFSTSRVFLLIVNITNDFFFFCNAERLHQDHKYS